MLLKYSLIFIILSSWKGFIKSILSLLTWIGSIIITIYSYETLALFITEQISKVAIIKNYNFLNNFIGVIISIIVIFLITLFILKKIRKYIVSDIDNTFIGEFFDKLIGFFYGVVFSYLIFSTFLYGMEKLEILNILYLWVIDNSYILEYISFINKELMNFIIPTEL